MIPDDAYMQRFGGTFKGFYEEFARRYEGRGTALQMVQMVVDTFPSFRDETELDGRKGTLATSLFFSFLV